MRATVPVQPDPETARGWVQAELADPAYHERVDLMTLILRWVQERLDEILQAADGRLNATAAAVVVAAVLVVAVLTWWIAGPLRRRRRAVAAVDIFGQDERTATELRASAAAAAAAGDWDTAVVERFRALLRSLDERALLDLAPGSTAHEAAVQAAARFPDRTVELVTASAVFDDVRYGDRQATAAEARAMADLDVALVRTAPAPVPPAPEPAVVP